MSDVERLAEVLADAFGLDWKGTSGEPDGSEIARECAEELLASDWLAEYVATATAEERERIARSIEAKYPVFDRFRDGHTQTMVTAYDEGLRTAVRIARQEPT